MKNVSDFLNPPGEEYIVIQLAFAVALFVFWAVAMFYGHAKHSRKIMSGSFLLLIPLFFYLFHLSFQRDEMISEKCAVVAQLFEDGLVEVNKENFQAYALRCNGSR